MSVQTTDKKKVRTIQRVHPDERVRTAEQPPDPGALLFTRRQSAKKLSCSVMKIIRLENAGLLRKVRLPPGSTGKVFNPAADVLVLAQGGE